MPDVESGFEQHIPPTHLGSFKNACLFNGPRAGCTDTDEIAAAVRSVFARRSDAAALAIVRAMDDHPNELKAYLLSIMGHDRQPEALRLQRRQRGRAEGVRRW